MLFRKQLHFTYSTPYPDVDPRHEGQSIDSYTNQASYSSLAAVAPILNNAPPKAAPLLKTSSADVM